MDYSKHGDVLEALKRSQDADEDNREAAREAHLFLDKREGQWEPYWWQQNQDQPRYTFDFTNPIVDTICGDIDQADFDIHIEPAGGEATKDTAKLYDGLIRNIESISSAPDVFAMSARGMVTGGFDAWQIKQKYVDDNSFDQDLVIEAIANPVDSVWLGPFYKPDASDTQWAVVLEAMDKGEYDETWPEGSGMSVGQQRTGNAYYNKNEQVIVGNIYWIERKPRTLLLMSSGRVLDAEAVEPVLDELEASGETVVSTRKRMENIVKSRLFDGGDWLNEPQDTVFNQVPVIPCFANFKVFEDKVLYRGVVEKLFDPQRVFNYSKSREIAEGALAPRAKYWMTEDQAAGHEDELMTLNTNGDPVQFYNPDPQAPGVPQQVGGAQINPGLKSIGDDMRSLIQQSAGLFAASMGDNPNLQSGVAIERLQEKGDIGTFKFFKAMERAICRTAKILVDAIPQVYSAERQVRIMKEDGTYDMTVINQPVFDQQSMQMVTVNDLSQGKYDVTCTVAKSFTNRQQETVEALKEIAPFDPSVIELGGDVLFQNLTSPGMDLIGERKRKQLFEAGVIPIEQMTEEEQQQYMEAQQAAAQNQQPDPATLIAQAEIAKAQAQTNKVNVDAQVAQAKLQQAQQSEEFKRLAEMQKMQMEQQSAIIDAVKTQAETLKTIREALGADTVIAPAAVAAYNEQAGELLTNIDKQ